MWPFRKAENARIVRAVADLKQRVPFIDDLWVMASMARVRIEMLRAKFQIPSIGSKHQLLTAFYLGSIEGEIRKQVQAEMTLREIGDFALGVALYTAQKDGVISADDQWVSLGTEYQQFYMNPENNAHRLLGIKYSGLWNHDSESAWVQLEKQLSQ